MAFLKNYSRSNTGIFVTFPTCIYQGHLEDHLAYNPILVEEINRIKKDPVVEQLSNQHYGVGWTSYHATNGDFNSKYNLTNNIVTEKLQKLIWDCMVDYLSYIGVNIKHIECLRLGVMWANINHKYSYHSAHIHPNCYYSGVYYIKVPKNSGRILFNDPRNSIRTFELDAALEKQHSDAMIRQLPIEPIEGNLVLFPSWLSHEVEQNLSDDDRISIAFNIIPNFEIISNNIKEATNGHS